MKHSQSMLKHHVRHVQQESTELILSDQKTFRRIWAKLCHKIAYFEIHQNSWKFVLELLFNIQESVIHLFMSLSDYSVQPT